MEFYKLRFLKGNLIMSGWNEVWYEFGEECMELKYGICCISLGFIKSFYRLIVE